MDFFPLKGFISPVHDLLLHKHLYCLKPEELIYSLLWLSGMTETCAL